MKKEKTDPDKTPCAICGAYRSHAHDCTSGSLEEQLARWKAWGEHYSAQYLRLQARRQRQHEITELWHGKYAIVKHENNQLRRRVRLIKERSLMNDMKLTDDLVQECFRRYIDLMHTVRRGIELDAETRKEWEVLQMWQMGRAAYANAVYELLEFLDARERSKKE